MNRAEKAFAVDGWVNNMLVVIVFYFIETKVLEQLFHMGNVLKHDIISIFFGDAEDDVKRFLNVRMALKDNVSHCPVMWQ